MAKRKRKTISVGTETEVLTKSRRRCCLCYYLEERRDAVLQGQIAHLDQDRSNSSADNLVWLCLPHHDQFDSTPSVSKGITANEVKVYRDRMITEIAAEDTTGVPPASPPQEQLEVRACSTRRGRVSLAQVIVESIGIRPIRIVAWYYFWNDGTGEPDQMHEERHHSLPVVLNERDTHELLGTLECRGSQVTGIGVLDSDGKRWDVPAEQIAAFARVAAQHSFPEHLLSDEDRIPDDSSGQDIAISVRAEDSPQYPHERLVVTIANSSTVPVRVFSADIEWEYEPHRHLSEAGNSKQVAEVGGAVSLSHAGSNEPIPAGGSREYFVDGVWAGVLQSAASPDVLPEKIKITVATSRNQGWQLTGDGLPEAVISVARSVATAQARSLI